ncbi:14-3-3 protein zeta-like [Saccoglossus kowalevskii]|uniref:14-3-3 protein zeta-like n=1 Tax=Saccoglossus kowalevskii TaxID=10224 RepID=A0ABM0GIH8_SACKO|nr:PREDICTED: 14-3-3 protein zeta-like [Saccoglossus kowalevskii]
MVEDRASLVLRARIAEQAERYDDMAASMKTLTESDVDLLENERNLLSIAYKNMIGTRRNAWRVISTIEEAETKDTNRELCSKYREKIENELRKICGEVQGLLDKYLIPKADCTEGKVFYLKTKGDYYRYLAEVSRSDERKQIVEDASKAYQDAFEAGKTLPPTNHIQLGLVLNLSVFHYEILNERDKARELAKQAFQDALADVQQLDDGDEALNKDNMLIIQLLRDNLSLWESEEGNEET